MCSEFFPERIAARRLWRTFIKLTTAIGNAPSETTAGFPLIVAMPSCQGFHGRLRARITWQTECDSLCCITHFMF